MPNIGENAPNFKLPRDGGGSVSLSDYAGQHVILYFYPRDNTPGCTTQAIEFSADIEKFAALNTVVLGVSKDDITSHDKFVAKKALTIPLLSDADSDLCEQFGVWVEKNMYGKKFMGIERSTFLIDPDGIITHAWRKVKVKGHVEQVLKTLGDLVK